jgi:hypothetical protein
VVEFLPSIHKAFNPKYCKRERQTDRQTEGERKRRGGKEKRERKDREGKKERREKGRRKGEKKESLILWFFLALPSIPT